MRAVIDTNVSVVANGRDTHASPPCQLSCVKFLQNIISPNSHARIVLDETGLIIDEYKSYLNYSGQPGVGDVFFKYLHDHMYLDKKVQLVSITQIADDTRGFDELPVNSVDYDDRMFLAAALNARAIIVNAVDSDWHEKQQFITNLGVTVRQLCPDHCS